MSSVQKTKEGTYRVQFYLGKSKRQKTFKTKAEAYKFAVKLESSPYQISKKYTLVDLLQKYKKEVTPKKHSAKAEGLRIDRFYRLPMATLAIGEVDKATIQKYVDDRLVTPNTQRGGFISPATVIKEVQVLSGAFNYAIDLGWLKDNPCHKLPPFY